MPQPTNTTGHWTDPQRRDALRTLQRVIQCRDRMRQQLTAVRCQFPAHSDELTQIARPVMACCTELLEMETSLKEAQTPRLSPDEFRSAVAKLNSQIGHWNVQLRQPRWQQVLSQVKRETIEDTQLLRMTIEDQCGAQLTLLSGDEFRP